MSIIQGNALGGTVDTGDIQKSLRFSAARSTYLSRTPSNTTNQTKWTWSGWVKRGILGTNQGLFDAYANSNNFTMLLFDTSNRIWFYNIVGGADSDCITTSIYRDPSAWLHIIFVYDTTNATSSDRFIFYVNGVRVPVTNPYGVPGLNEACYVNANSALHCVGRITDNTRLLDGYLSRVCFVDGQALTPTSFGYFNTEINEWVTKSQSDIKAVVDAGGTNSFMLDFDNGTSLTTLGYDKSSKGNNWTLNGHSLTTGVNYDWMGDVPGNSYATLNPLSVSAVSPVADGGLRFNTVAGSYCLKASHVINTPTYFEFGWGSAGLGAQRFGVATAQAPSNTECGADANGWALRINNAGASYGTWHNNALTSTGYSAGSGADVGMCAVDPTSGKIWFGRNGTWFNGGDPNTGANPGYSNIPSEVFPAFSGNTWDGVVNFGQRPFASTPPSGFKSVCSANLPVPTITNPKKHFDVRTRTGTGTSSSSTGLLFSPGLVWSKSRNSPSEHGLQDSVRGANKELKSNSTSSEVTYTDTIMSFNSDGVSFGADASTHYNASGQTYVDWMWKAGGSAVSNTSGTITSQVSANPTAGFSIVTYTGTGANATVGHGLGVAPKMVIVKERTNVDGNNWNVWHYATNGTVSTRLQLNTTTADVGDGSTIWNTVPTSSVFGLGSSAGCNGSTRPYVAYCFAEIPGFSKIGSYVGNGASDGPFVHCGFKPKFVMVKNASAGYTWLTFDSVRDTENVNGQQIYPNSPDAEVTDNVNNCMDFLSNGFKFRGGSAVGNGNGNTIIFLAFADVPFKYANAR